MAKLSAKELGAWEIKRDLNAELKQALHEMKRGEWARKTEFTTQPDGSIRRIISRRDGTIEKGQSQPGFGWYLQCATEKVANDIGVSDNDFKFVHTGRILELWWWWRLSAHRGGVVGTVNVLLKCRFQAVVMVINLLRQGQHGTDIRSGWNHGGR